MRPRIVYKALRSQRDFLSFYLGASPLAARLRTGKVIKSRSRVGIDDAECRRLFVQIDEHARENCVLENVGETAGVKRMAIVHLAITA